MWLRSLMNRPEHAACHLCPLKDQAPVTPVGVKGPIRLVIVGEAPTQSDVKSGSLFTGLSGRLLDDCLHESGLNRSKVYLTNAVLCPRAEASDKEVEEAARCCAPRLLHELRELPADIPILSAGKLPTISLLGVRKLLKARGFVWSAREITNAEAKRKEAFKHPEGPARDKALLGSEFLRLRGLLASRRILPTLAFPFVVRADTWHPIIRLDVNRAAKSLPGLDTDENTFTETTDIPSLNELGAVVSLDIETSGINPLDTDLLCVGISDGHNTKVVWPWKDSYAEPLARFLASRESVVCHNGYNFDQLVLEAHGVELAGINWEDTLLAHHSYASHLPQSLSHLVGSYCDAYPWKLVFKGGADDEKGGLPQDLPKEELLKYNALDCKLTALCWERLQRDLAREPAVYEHDKQLAVICQQMIRNGIRVDVRRKKTLTELLRRRAGGLKGQMRALVSNAAFNPGSVAQVRAALLSLGASFTAQTAGGMMSTSNATLEALKGPDTPLGKFCTALLQWRGAKKTANTYLTPLELDRHSRVHFNWKPFGTVAGRLSCRLQSCPRHSPKTPEERVREVYVPSKGCEFVYFDVSQAEMRLAAYLSSDPNLIQACAGDIHANNAKLLFPQIAAKGWLDGDKQCRKCKLGFDSDPCSCSKKDPLRGKPYRDIAKNVGFAISYCAEAEKVFITLRSQGFNVSMAACEVILGRLHAHYKVYYRWVENNLVQCRKIGHMRSPIVGRIRWLGWFPKITEVANFPIQSALADVVNMRMIELSEMLNPAAKLVAQIHDACIYDVPKELVNETRNLIQRVWNKPIILAGGLLTLPIDLKTGERWSEL